MTATARPTRVKNPGSLRAAIRTVVRFWTPFLAGLAAFVAVTTVRAYVVPATRQPTSVTTVASPLNRLYAGHHCSATAGPGRPMLLISTPSSGAQLVEAATTEDGRLAERDRLTDQHADLFGWCER